MDTARPAADAASPDTAARALLASLERRLGELQARLDTEPQYNPVRQLAFELSRALEAGETGMDQLSDLVCALTDDAFLARAGRLNGYIGPVDEDTNQARLDELIAPTGDFDAFVQRWSQRRYNAVFTAHPTFLLARRQRHLLTDLAAQDTAEARAETVRAQRPLRPAPDPDITLDSEHEAVLHAIDHAKNALERLTRTIIATARTHYPDRWRDLVPTPVGLATWVGYDLDGRTDILWADAVRFRLEEKRVQLARYLDRARALELAELAATLDGAIGHLDDQIEAFHEPLYSPAKLGRAADLLTADHPHRLTRIQPLMDRVQAALDAEPDGPRAEQLAALRADMTLFGLGAARIHLRINATQLHNAIRRRLDLGEDAILSSRSLRERLGTMIEEAKATRVNFAALAIENTTAVRQFITIAQILKHVDADSPIRLLIAECEQSVTVLSAIYFAHLFGVADKVDVSPLFETPQALERAGRMLDVLLGTPEYAAAVRARGRLCIQTGFSDAGRFVGQIPAALSIERLHGRLARLADRHGLTDVDIVVFDTHGESMGRGAHPASMVDRFLYVLSPWARRQFDTRGFHLIHETSFQGGDGYALFGSDALALACLTRALEADRAAETAQAADLLYDDVNFSFDFFRKVKAYQEHLLEEPAYHKVLSAFGLSLLFNTGSRKSRRQSDIAADAGPAVRKIRAIPNNAILQQLGYLANVVAGIGMAVRSEQERFSDMYRQSDRMRRLIAMAVAAKQGSSLKTLVAYGSLYDGAFWATRPYGGQEPELTEACVYLASLLQGDDRHDAIMRLATHLRLDALMLHKLLDTLDMDQDFATSSVRRGLDVLHAVRLALIQHIFLLAARVPRFSTRNDVSREDIMELIFELRVPEAVELLRNAYPVHAPKIEDFALAEPTDYPDETASGYADLNRTLIDPIEDTYRLVLEIGVGIALAFNAHG